MSTPVQPSQPSQPNNTHKVVVKHSAPLTSNIMSATQRPFETISNLSRVSGKYKNKHKAVINKNKKNYNLFSKYVT